MLVIDFDIPNPLGAIRARWTQRREREIRHVNLSVRQGGVDDVDSYCRCLAILPALRLRASPVRFATVSAMARYRLQINARATA